MDKSQYYPPNTEHSAEIYQQIEQSTIKSSPERIQAPFQFTKDIETLIDSIRETAEAIEQKKGNEVRFRHIPITFIRPARPHAEIFKEQLDNERSLTTELFAEKNKYSVWYGGKAHTPQATPNLASWFIEERVPGKPGAGRITRIQTHPNYIQMFNHEGQLMPMTISDLEVFVPLVRHYVDTVLPAYPFDKDRAELLLEDIDMPDNIAMLLPPEHVEGRKSDYDRTA